MHPISGFILSKPHLPTLFSSNLWLFCVPFSFVFRCFYSLLCLYLSFTFADIGLHGPYDKVKTIWEERRTSHYLKYYQILNLQIISFTMIYNVSGLPDVKGPKYQYLFQKFLCFLMFSVMFIDRYLLKSEIPVFTKFPDFWKLCTEGCVQ